MDKEQFLQKLKNVKCVLFDLDGTLYMGGTLIPNAVKAVENFRKHGVKIVFLSNNSSRSSKECENKLQKMGLYEPCDEVMTSCSVTCKYLVENGLNKNVYVFGTESVKAEFKNSGVQVVPDSASVAVLTFNVEMTYKDVFDFNKQLNNGAKYIATHPDVVCPSDNGDLPDNGSFIKMFEASSSRVPDVVVGKPFTVMGEELLKHTGLKPENVLMVGDRLYTDISFGINCKFLTALVLSGETTLDMAKQSEIKADGIFENVFELSNLLNL